MTKKNAQLILTALLITAPTLSLAAGSSAIETGGFGAWIIDSLFEAGSISNMPNQAGIIGTTLIPLSLIAMLVAVLIIVVKSMQHLLVVAQAKDIDQSPVSMTWAPLHMVMAVVLIMPLPSGYSMGQYGAIWIAHQSNTLGNITAERALDYFTTRGAITPPVLPSIQTAAKGIVASQICRSLNNKSSAFVESQDGTPITVEPRALTESEARSLGGAAMSGSTDNLTRAGVTFNREKAQGGTWYGGGGNTIDGYCGTLFVQYTAQTNGLFGQELEVPVEKVLSSTPSSTSSDLEKCQYGPLCLAASDTSLKDMRQSAIDTFASAHSSASSKFMAEAQGNAGVEIAESILWDMDLYFEGKTDTGKAEDYVNEQINEKAKIDDAVQKTITLIDRMQNDVYGAYTDSLRQFKASTNNQGNDFIDTVKQVGWPIFGLYWFQYTSFSQKVMDSVSIQTFYTGETERFLQMFSASVDDPVLAQRLQSRIDAYTARLANALQNTRFDPAPGSDSSAAVSTSTTMSVDAAMKSSTDALDIREAFPAIKAELIANAKLGAITPDNVYETIQQSINTVMRGTIFPMLVSPLRQDNLVNALVNTGHNILTVSETVYISKLLWTGVKAGLGPRGPAQPPEAEESESLFSKALSFFPNPLSGLVNAGKKIVGFAEGVLRGVLAVGAKVMSDFAGLWFYIFLAGLFLAFYIPAMIMIQWLVGLVTWMIYIVEATVVIPLWGLLFTADMGQRAFAPQTAQQGFVHLLSILVYPSLMVIGFVMGLKIIDLTSTFLVDFLIIGLLNSTDGYTFGILSLASGLIILGLACYQILTRIFSLTLELNDRAMSWVGNRQGYGEGNVEQQTRGGVVAAIGKVEMKGRSPGKDPANGGQLSGQDPKKR